MPPARPKKLKQLAIAAAATIATLILAELAVRVKARIDGTPYSRYRTELHVRTQADQMVHRVAQVDGEETSEDVPILHPYLAFDHASSLRATSRDAKYFRTEQSRTTFDVLVLGGSVAANFGNMGGDRLAELLFADPRLEGRPVRVHNYARGAHKQPQQIIALSFLLSLGFQPDAVLTIDGFNEVALASENFELETNPLYPARAQWAPVAGVGVVDRAALDVLLEVREHQRAAVELAELAEGPLAWTALGGRWLVDEIDTVRADWQTAQDHYRTLASGDATAVHRGPSFDEDPELAIRSSVAGWARCTRALQSICDGLDIPFLQVLQPTLHDAGSKPLTDDERRTGTASKAWLRGVRTGYPLLRTAAAGFGPDGVNHLDATMLFADIEETLYFDACHYRAPGSELMAEAIAPALLELMP